MDIVGPFTVSEAGNKYILTCIETFSSYLEAFPLKNACAEEVAGCLVDNIIFRYGMFSTILTDRGTNFMSLVFQRTAVLLGGQTRRTSPYHPASNGALEAQHKTLGKSISKLIDQQDPRKWDQYLKAVVFAMNSSTNVNSTAFSPHEIIFGCNPKLPAELTITTPKNEYGSHVAYFQHLIKKMDIIHGIVLKNREQSKRDMKQQYDRNAKDIQFDVGDRVFLYYPHVKVGACKKTNTFWLGPYEVIERVGQVNYRLRLENNRRIHSLVHANRLRPVYKSLRPPSYDLPKEVDKMDDLAGKLTEDDIPPSQLAPQVRVGVKRALVPPTLEQRQKEVTEAINNTDGKKPDAAGADVIYYVEKILRHKKRGDTTFYKVKWKGYTDTTWEPAANFMDDQLLQQYHDGIKKKTGRRKRRQ